MVYCLILQKPYVLFILPSPKWLVLVVQERLGLALNLAWNWTVMVDKGSNAKAKTKDKSGKSHWGLFCSPEHWEKTWGDSETAYKPLRGEKMKRGEWGDAGRTEKDKDQRPTTGKEAANETMRVIKLDRKGRGGRRRWDIKRNWIIKTVCVRVCVCANVASSKYDVQQDPTDNFLVRKMHAMYRLHTHLDLCYTHTHKQTYLSHTCSNLHTHSHISVHTAVITYFHSSKYLNDSCLSLFWMNSLKAEEEGSANLRNDRLAVLR